MSTTGNIIANTAVDDSMAVQRLPSPPATPAAAIGLTPGSGGHPVISADTFCYQYLSQISGLRCETIVCLMANGFDTIHTLLAIDPDVDLPVLADEGVPMAQRCLLRRALRELVDHYHRLRDQMVADCGGDGQQRPPVDPQLTTRQLLVEQFVRGEQLRHREFMRGLAMHLDDQSTGTGTTAPVAPDGSVGNTTTDGYVSAAADYDDDDDSGDDGSGEGSGSGDDEGSGGDGGADGDDNGDQTVNKSTAPATEREARAARRDRSRTMTTEDSDDSDVTRETNDNDRQLNPQSSGSDGGGGYENFMATSEYITQTQPNVVLSPLRLPPLRVSQAKSQPTKTSPAAKTLAKKYKRKKKSKWYNKKRNISSSPEKAAKSVKSAAIVAKKVVKSSEKVVKSSEKVVKSNEKVPKSTAKATKGNKKVGIPAGSRCSVCTDTMKLTHQLGVWLCNGCSIFMRRVLRGQRAPGDCRKGTGECVINLESRKHCPHCRYQKGLAVGIDPDTPFAASHKTSSPVTAANTTAAINISATSTTTTVSAIESQSAVTTASAAAPTLAHQQRAVELDLNDATDSIASIECGRSPTDEAPDRGYYVSQPSAGAANGLIGYLSPRKRVHPFSDTMATTSQVRLL